MYDNLSTVGYISSTNSWVNMFLSELQRTIMVSFIFWQLLFLIILFCLPITVLTAGNETDKLSLLNIKAQITDDPFHSLSSWNESLHFCQWFGVKCGTRHQRVVELDLSSRQLKGRLSPHIGNLSFLRSLNLKNNSLSNKVPQELGRLFRLQKFSIRRNMFTGQIPASISNCSNLEGLDLGKNDLTGRLPAELGLLSKLNFLVFEVNSLVDDIPESFGNLSSLEILGGTDNYLSGTIPDSIGQLKRVTFFSLGANNLIGAVPSSIYNLSSLALLSLPVNQLGGTFPSDVGINLPSLQILRMHTNLFSGMIPGTIVNASNLLTLSLSGNMFTGKVPPLPNVNNLQEVAVDENDLGNGEDDDLSFFYPLGNNTNLEILSIADNRFAGVLPQVLCNFSTKLSKINFGRNQIRGSIPTEIGNLVGMVALGMEGNQLTGTIPTSIGKLYNLNDFYLNDNKLSGRIPSSLGNLSSLGRLSLRQNNLQGNIPPSIRKCQKLLYMALAQNNLSGPIPKEILGISSLSLMLDLSDNQLTGLLPLEVSELVNLGSLDVNTNKLSGEIPASLGSCLSLEILNLGNNFFQGSIPQSLSALRAIQSLNFSHNNLSGQIPMFVGDFQLLNNLDLSFNEFEGEVPLQGVFANASAVSLFGNKKLCGGITHLGLSKCPSNKSNSSSKVNLIVALVCAIIGIILIIVFVVIFCCLKKKRRQKDFGFSGDISMWRVSFEEIFKATDGFSSTNLIGVGSFGSVYKAVFRPDEKTAAVKVLNLSQKGASKSFMAECKSLASIRHRNLVKLLTACSSIDSQGNDFKALIYEFMANGNLDERLHPVQRSDEAQNSGNYLSLTERLDIMIDVASALEYLHNGSHVSIVHCDLKPSNVLLNENMTAHVGDFGLARVVPEASRQLLFSSQTNSIGTIGYAAPEYGMGSEVSAYGDVYSYGILVLEMFTGKRPTDGMFKDGLNLHDYVKMALSNNAVAVIDPILLRANEKTDTDGSDRTSSNSHDNVSEILFSVLKVGVSCSGEIPKERMEIADAAAELRQIKSTLFGAVMHKEPEDSV